MTGLALITAALLALAPVPDYVAPAYKLAPMDVREAIDEAYLRADPDGSHAWWRAELYMIAKREARGGADGLVGVHEGDSWLGRKSWEKAMRAGRPDRARAGSLGRRLRDLRRRDRLREASTMSRALRRHHRARRLARVLRMPRFTARVHVLVDTRCPCSCGICRYHAQHKARHLECAAAVDLREAIDLARVDCLRAAC